MSRITDAGEKIVILIEEIASAPTKSGFAMRNLKLIRVEVAQ